MIAFISGKLVLKRPAEATIEVGGVGFNILIPTSTFERLPMLGEPVKLSTHLHVREDALKLFGFSSDSERTLFQLMIRASGIGPKLALAALSAMSPADLSHNISSGNNIALTRIPGVGRKTADRLIVELQDRVKELVLEETDSPQVDHPRADAIAALETLGLTRAAAERKLKIVERKYPDTTAASDLIRLVLQE